MKYLDCSQLQAKLSGRSRSSIYRDVKRGWLPKPRKLGRLNYWDESEVDEFLTRSME